MSGLVACQPGTSDSSLSQSGGGPAVSSGGMSPSGGAPPGGGAQALGGNLPSGGELTSGGATSTGGTRASGGSLSNLGGSGGGLAGGSGGSDGGSGGIPSGGSGGNGQTGGTGGSAPACDTSWDTYPKKGDQVALTPPMGWNSWNAFHENISETQIRKVADVLVSSGLRDAGYVYLNLDDKWMDDDGRDGSGKLYGDSARFPSGIAALADYVHSKGLKFGLYGDRGTETCAHRESPSQSGSYGRETQDAQTFASWGVDYLKYDNCAIAPGRDNDSGQQGDYKAMSDALRATGRPIVFSICAWDAKSWMPNIGHLWRSTFDIGLCFSGCDEWYQNIDEIIDENNQTADWAGPGHWNDPDMLEVGNGLTHDEDVAHFSMWAVMAAPLILGNDIRTMSDSTREILTNKEVIAVNQDAAGVQGRRVAKNGTQEVWMKPLCNLDGPEKAVVLLNRGGSGASLTVQFADIGIAGRATVRDLWAHADLGEKTGSFTANVPSHGVVMVKITSLE